MAWLILVLAGLCEVIGVAGMSRLAVKKDTLAWVLLLGGFSASLTLLGEAMRSISMGTAYAVWTGIGSAGGALVGMIFYGESRRAKRLLFLGMVIAAAIGLKWIG
jgi:paired small multidrug resistance pump